MGKKEIQQKSELIVYITNTVAVPANLTKWQWNMSIVAEQIINVVEMEYLKKIARKTTLHKIKNKHTQDTLNQESIIKKPEKQELNRMQKNRGYEKHPKAGWLRKRGYNK